MAKTASDIVSDEDVRAQADRIRNQYLQVRRVFRDHDGTGLDSGTFSFPVSDNNFDGEAVEVGAGEDYPRATRSDSEVQAAYKKYGLEIALPDEVVEDSAIDVELDDREDMMRAEERRVETVAFNVLDANTDPTGTIDAGNATAGTLEQDDFELAKERALENELALGELEIIASASDYSDFVNFDGFTRASELGDQVVEQGVLPGGDLVGQGLMGTLFDMPVYVENVGNVSSGDAYVVDTSNFGWESERDPMDVTSYREENKDQDVFKINGRWDWVATQPSANIKIDT